MASIWSKIRDHWKSVRQWLGRVNPFVFFGVLFLGYMILPPFSGQYSLWSQLKTQHRLRTLRSEHKKLQSEIEESRKKLEELQLHKDMLEKYAREKFLMKAEDEDLFLLKK